MSEKSKAWVPNTKVMAGSLGGTIAGLLIDVLEGRLQVVLATGELNAIVIFSGLLVAYFMPETTKVRDTQ